MRAEAMVLRHDRLFGWTLLLALLYQTFSLRQALVWRSTGGGVGYFTYQSVIALVQLGWLSLAVVLSSVIERDHEWMTAGARVAVEGRAAVLLGKMGVALIVTVGVFLACVTMGAVLDLIGGEGVVSAASAVRCTSAGLLVLLSWVFASMFASALTRSFLVGCLGTVCLFLVEVFADRYLPKALVRALPVENARALLNGVLPSDGGFIMVPAARVVGPTEGWVYYGAFLVAVLAALWGGWARRDL